MISNQIYSKKTNNTYLMQQNHHQILENNRLPMKKQRERESNKEQIKINDDIKSNHHYINFIHYYF